MFKKEKNNLVGFACVVFLLLVLFYILVVGSSIIIPFVIALLFSFAIISLANFYKKLKIPKFFAFILSFLTYFLVFWLVGKIVSSNIYELVKLSPIYQGKILEIYHNLFEYLNIPEPESLTEILQTVNFQSILKSIITAFTSLFSRMGLIIFFVIFILLESKYFEKKMYLILCNNSRNAEIIETLDMIKKDIKSYFVVKTCISLITAIFCYLVMLFFHLDFAAFWALLVFILNFIPNIGSIIAVFFPAILSLVQPGFTFGDSLLMTISLTIVQMLMGNVIDPQFMGNRLNLSPLVIVISLAFWGMIRSVIGMLLSVPIMVIINIILAKIPTTRPIAVLLSEKGDLRVESPEQIAKNRKKLLKAFKDKFDMIEVIKKK